MLFDDHQLYFNNKHIKSKQESGLAYMHISDRNDTQHKNKTINERMNKIKYDVHTPLNYIDYILYNNIPNLFR